MMFKKKFIQTVLIYFLIGDNISSNYRTANVQRMLTSIRLTPEIDYRKNPRQNSLAFHQNEIANSIYELKIRTFMLELLIRLNLNN